MAKDWINKLMNLGIKGRGLLIDASRGIVDDFSQRCNRFRTSVIKWWNGFIAYVSGISLYLRRYIHHWRAVVRHLVRPIYSRRRDYDSYHFYLCFAPLRRLFWARNKFSLNPDNKSNYSLSNSHRYYGLFLYPDGGLMAWYWYFGLALAGLVYWFSSGKGFIAFGASYFMLYGFVNHWILRRIPVFDGAIRRAINPRLLSWLLQRVPSIILTYKDARNLCSSFHRGDYVLSSWVEKAAWSNPISRASGYIRKAPFYRRRSYRNDSEYLLRSAIGYFFNSAPIGGGRDIRLLRFLMFWCAPLWISWASIMVVLIYEIMGHVDQHQYDINIGGRILYIVVWSILSGVFLLSVYRHINSTNKWRSASEDTQNLRRMPASLVDILSSGVDLPKAVARPGIRNIISVVFSGLVVTYFTVLMILMDTYKAT